MCGRYFLKMLAAWNEYAEIQDAGWQPGFSSFNIAPSQDVPALRLIDGKRHGAMLRWGLVPFFAKGEPPKYSTINATCERIESGPVWRGPWNRGQRCILPASGFYEWHLNDDGTKQPFAVEAVDQPVFGIAGLWDRSVSQAGAAIESCAIVTLPASALMAEIHNSKRRMPAILRIEDRGAWLAGSGTEAKAALRQYPDDLLRAARVSTRVNSPRNNDARLIAPLDREPTDPALSGNRATP
ncbi:MAG: SOS response-associated peptidase [Steroidobacteraceae bacterium]